MNKRKYPEAFDALAASRRIDNVLQIDKSVNRSFEMDQQLPQSDNIYTNQTVDVDEQLYEIEDTQPTRSFIALQACESCRIKKTRCDEERPCGLCKAQGRECVYKERKVSRLKEASLSTLMSAMRRIESKLDEISSTNNTVLAFPEDEFTGKKNTWFVQALSDVQPKSSKTQTPLSPCEVQSPDKSLPEPIEQESSHAEDNSVPGRIQIPFSQHQSIFWPVFLQYLPNGMLEPLLGPRTDYAVELEMRRPKLSMTITPYPDDSDDSWLEDLQLSMITGLSEIFFATINLSYPVLDRAAYFSETISVIVREGFSYNAESCLVLSVLALGCMAVKAYKENDFPLPITRSSQKSSNKMTSDNHFKAPSWINVIDEEHPGLRFFNEARQRVGVLICSNDLVSCQFYILGGIYNSQLVRPTDSWTMFNRACICCLTLLKSGIRFNSDEWEGDMYCRLFWTALMFETILIQELNLPDSGLRHFENLVPIPKFTRYIQSGKSVSKSADDPVDDTFFQFHFLAQVAHRLILTRIQNTLFFHSESESFPPSTLVQELHHQLEQWRSSLPESIRFDNNATISQATTPAHAYVTALLHTRYKVAKFHIGRQFCYKALNHPSSLSDGDISACHDGLVAAMNWSHVIGPYKPLPHLTALMFAMCSQFFGQLLLFAGFKRSPDYRVRQALPDGYEKWCRYMLDFLKEQAPYSPVVAQDVKIIEEVFSIES